MAEKPSSVSPPPPSLELKDLAKNGREEPEGDNEKEKERFIKKLGLSRKKSADAIAYSNQLIAPAAAPTLPPTPVPPSSSSSPGVKHIYYVVKDTGTQAGDRIIPNHHFLHLIDDLDVERTGGRKIIQDLHLEVELLKYQRDQCRKGANQVQVELQKLNADRHDYGGKGFYEMEPVNRILFQITTAMKGQIALMALRLPKDVNVKTQLDSAFLDFFTHIKNSNRTTETGINKTNALGKKLLEDAGNQAALAAEENQRIVTLVTESFTDLNACIAEVADQISNLREDEIPPFGLSTMDSSDSSSASSSDLLEVIRKGFDEIKKVVKELKEGYQHHHQLPVPCPPNPSEEVEQESFATHNSIAIAEEEEPQQEYVQIPVLGKSGRAKSTAYDDDDDDSFYPDPDEIITPRPQESLDRKSRKARHERIDRYRP